MRVMHDRYGTGAVVSVEPEEDDYKVTVAFDDGAERSFLASLVAGTKLQAIE
jgi:hypothetical protein